MESKQTSGHYDCDYIYEPPVPPLQTNWAAIDNVSEKSYVEELFEHNSLPYDWKIVLREGTELFLCFNWVHHRLLGDLQDHGSFPKEGAMETTCYTVAELTKIVTERYQLEECTANDDSRIVIIWAVKPYNDKNRKSIVGHIQVRHKGRWESKLSQHCFVITHGEMTFEGLKDGNLGRAVTFRRKAGQARS